jgi:hypothetical protein
MESKTISIIAASTVAIIFMFIAIQPGIINMIGYGVFKSLFSRNSLESIKYEKAFLIFFDFLLGLILFWFVYKIANRILK